MITSIFAYFLSFFSSAIAFAQKKRSNVFTLWLIRIFFFFLFGTAWFTWTFSSLMGIKNQPKIVSSFGYVCTFFDNLPITFQQK